MYQVVNGEEKVWYTHEMSGYYWVTYREFKDMVDAFGSGLRELGLDPV